MVETILINELSYSKQVFCQKKKKEKKKKKKKERKKKEKWVGKQSIFYLE